MKKWIGFLSSLLVFTSGYLQCRENFFNDDAFIEKSAGHRNYNAPVEEEQKKNIRFILKTLAQKSNVVSLLGKKTELENAGKNIERIHPFRFLETVFTDEELKAYFHQIKKKGGMYWSELTKGLKSSLQEELIVDNLKDEFVFDFAANVKIKPDLIHNLILKGQWEDFVKALLKHIPRDVDSARYGN
jgi:hypothetical protein